MKLFKNHFSKNLIRSGCIFLAAMIFCMQSGCRKNEELNNKSSAVSSLSSAMPVASSEETVSQSDKTELNITSPKKNNVTVTEPEFTFTGSCEPGQTLLFNGEALITDDMGFFSKSVTLNIGANSFSIEYIGEKRDFTVNYRYIVIKNYDPGDSRSFESGTTFAATVNARAGAKCSAVFNGQTVSMKRAVIQDESEENINPADFCDFVAFFTLPGGNSSDLNLGKITFNASYNGITDTAYSGKIICKKTYVPVIAEVTAASAETFNGASSDNWTRPTNNYLPAGTVDYVNGSYSVNDGKYKNNFLILRCGRRIYSDMPITPGNSRVQVAKTYEGILPDHNELSVAEASTDSRRTYITLNTLWKAPFFLDYKPQSYTNSDKQDYTVNSVSFTYIDIEFCYATVFRGTVEFTDNPLFSSAQIIPGNGSTTLRLHLKTAGKFYGWDCSYNQSGQLVFEFLHPPMGIPCDTNEYGIDLSGLKIVVDAGHGGFDSGALGNGMLESERNLNLALKIKTELEKTGATVLMTRTNDSALQSPARVAAYRNMKPDLLISVHHDSSTSSGSNGFGAYYTTPFSMPLAKSVYSNTVNTGIYNGGNNNKLAWHYFYMTRMTYCPSVLTENGFMCGRIDGSGIRSEEINLSKAKAIAMGVTEYLRSVSY